MNAPQGEGARRESAVEVESFEGTLDTEPTSAARREATLVFLVRWPSISSRGAIRGTTPRQRGDGLQARAAETPRRKWTAHRSRNDGGNTLHGVDAAKVSPRDASRKSRPGTIA